MGGFLDPPTKITTPLSGMRLRLSFFLFLFCCVALGAHGTEWDASTVKQRLANIEHQVSLPYHNALPNIIKNYSAKQLPAAFTVYESVLKEALKQQELPEEMIYLPVAMTNMKIDYRHDNRAGVWALPELVAIRYGLTVDDTHDERFSVEVSSRAAACYLKDLYEAHGDWWQCILAYANSPAAINNTRLRHPESDPSDPWSYYENQWLDNVRIVGNFIASYYVYSSDDKSVARSTEQYANCNFDSPVSATVLSSTLGIAEKTIRSLNPIFLTDQLIPLNGHPLRLPASTVQSFEEHKDDIYKKSRQLKEEKEKQAKIDIENKAKEQEKAKAKKDPEYIIYTVKKGDNLGKIAKKHHVKISDIKKWNKLKGDMIRESQKLKIYK